MKPVGSPNTKTNRMHEVDELIITEFQNKIKKYEVKPVERNNIQRMPKQIE